MHVVFAKISLGLVAIAMAEKGVCSIEFGDNKQDLEAGVLRNFPHGRIEPATAREHRVNAVIEAIDSPPDSTAIPIDIQGTVFQRRGWEASRAIPVSETRT